MTKTREQHKIDGTYREDRHGPDDKEMGLSFIESTIPPPTHLTEVAQKKWLSVIQDCSKVYGYIAVLDLNLLERYCLIYGEWSDLLKEYNRQKKKNEYTLMDQQKEWKQIMTLHDSMLVVEREMGFTPVARMKIASKLPEKPAEKVKEIDLTL